MSDHTEDEGWDLCYHWKIAFDAYGTGMARCSEMARAAINMEILSMDDIIELADDYADALFPHTCPDEEEEWNDS